MFSFLSFRHVVELGCGLGLTGIVACRTCGVRSYTFTDCHPQVLFLLAKNIETNLTHPSSQNWICCYSYSYNHHSHIHSTPNQVQTTEEDYI